MPTAWYALRTKPHKEQLVWHQVQVLGFEVFYPKLRANAENPRARRSKPYFPGYVFVSVDLEASGISAFQYMPHAIGMVRFDGEPGVIPEAAIVSLRRHICPRYREEWEKNRNKPEHISQLALVIEYVAFISRERRRRLPVKEVWRRYLGERRRT